MSIKQIIFGTLLLFAFTACERLDEPLLLEEHGTEGIPVKVTVPFKAQNNKIITRAEQSADLEQRINNVYLFIFDRAGNKIAEKFCTIGNGMTPDASNYSSGTLAINAESRNEARIVGIANLNEGNVTTAYDITPDVLEQITTYDELCALQMRLNERSVQRGSTFVMTGFATDTNGEEWIQIPGSENSIATLDCTLIFERTDAKVKFIVQTEAGDTNWQNFSFRPKDWQVHQVPVQALVMKDDAGNDADGADAEYFDSPTTNFEEITRDDLSALYKGGSFIFYMPENKKRPKQTIDDTNLSDEEAYALRDKQNKIPLPDLDPSKPGQTETNGDFAYANDHSTYVEMTGTLSYDYEGQNGIRYYVETDVRYIIHLGYASGDPNDYNTERNSYYTYTVTVKGVNDIIVEVTDETGGPGEVRPGAEGDVIYSTAGIYEFDAHYDRRLITLSLDNIPETEGGVTWGVRSPFGGGIYELRSYNFDGMEDYKWVKFAINKEYGVPDNEYVKYPGDQNYNDPKLPTSATNNAEPGSEGNYSNNNGANWREARLLDVQQFVDYVNNLKNESTETGRTLTVTVFIDEYVYFRNPITYANDLSLWKMSVNQPDRMLYLFIVPGESKYSPDGESCVINSVLTFKQKSLRTVYDTNHEDLVNDPDPNDNYQGLLGLESVMETGRLQTGGRAIQYGNSRSNGRRNTLRCILGPNYTNVLHWTDVLNTSAHYELDPTYNNALYACLMRNRDLNGDNIVQSSEIRWYLASVNQLVDIYIGQYSIDQEAWLYPENAADRPGANGLYWHYTTSTYNNGNPEVLWAEEGASLGSYNASQNRNGSLYAYRCVRNLGISLETPDAEPQPLFSYSETADGEFLIDASRLTPNSRRENFETGFLPEHDDLSINNLPYTYFQVQGASGDWPSPNNSGSYTWYQCMQYENEGRLPIGYRMPNQRELLIMMNILPDDAWQSYKGYDGGWSKAMYMCKTEFSRRGQGDFSYNRSTFRMNAQNKSIGVVNDVNDDKGYIRAVKDVRNP